MPRAYSPAAIPSLDGIYTIQQYPLEQLALQFGHLDLSALALATPPPAPRLASQNGGVRIIDVTGPLTKSGGWLRALTGGTATTDVVDSLEDATADASVKTILMRMDSPGGSVKGIADAADAVREARKVKRVIGFAEDQCCSAMYWIGVQCEKLYCNASCVVGSISTYAVVTDASRRADALGLTVHVVRAGAMKGVGVPGAPITAEQLAELQRNIDSFNNLFLQGVGTGRNLPMDYVRKIAGGEIFIGREAVMFKLADAVRTFASVLAELQGNAPPPALHGRDASAAFEQLLKAEMRSKSNPDGFVVRAETEKFVAAANAQLWQAVQEYRQLTESKEPPKPRTSRSAFSGMGSGCR